MNFEDFEQRLLSRLAPLDDSVAAMRGDRDLNPHWPEPAPRQLRDAAVLVPIVRRAEAWTMLFTERAADLASHPSQISFPGGKLEPGESAVEAALREATEEIGLDSSFVTPLGGFDTYETGTGFRIIPVVAFVEPGYTLTLDPSEVAEVFETPVAFLMDEANHERREGEWRGRKGAYYAMPYQGRFIWGATAGMVRALYERLYS